MPDAQPDNAKSHEPKHPLEYVIAAFLVLTFVATALAAYFTKQQWDVASDVEIRSLRAYVGLRPGVLTCVDCNGPVNGAPVKAVAGTVPRNHVEFFAKNAGVTPAYTATLKICWWRNEVHKPLPSDFNYICTVPEDEWSASTTVFGGTEGAFFSAVEPSDVIAARNQQIVLYAYGQIEYSDAFGVERSTPICQFYDPGGSDEHTTLWAECHAHHGPQAN